MSYRGRVLLEMETVLGERPIKPVEDILHEDVLRVQVLYTFEHCLLVKLLLNTSVIMLCLVVIIHCESKKLCHFYFYCNFGKYWSIFKILSMSESERNGS